jgi:glycosyltransferase involved in cell wall biosynthesis
MPIKSRIIISSQVFFPYKFGGGENYALWVAGELRRRGHEVLVLTSAPWHDGVSVEGTVYNNYQDTPVAYMHIKPKPVGIADSHLGLDRDLMVASLEVIRRFRPDVIHINGTKNALVNICNREGIPHVVTAHHTGIVCPLGGILRANGDICTYPEESKCCIPCYCYRASPHMLTGGFLGRMPVWLYRFLGNRWKNKSLPYLGRVALYPWMVELAISGHAMMLKMAQKIIVPSRFMEDLLMRNGCSPNKIVYFPHGIPPLKRTPLRNLKDRFLDFGFVGRADSSKGLQIILKALELLPGDLNCVLHIYGGGQRVEEGAFFHDLVENYKGRPEVKLHGVVAREQLGVALAELDVLIVPSLLPEAFGLVVAEAQAAGRPVIVSNSGALPELVRDEVDGLIVRRNDPSALAAAMAALITAPGTVSSMAANSPTPSTIGEYVDKLLALYDKVIMECTR